MRYFVAEKLTPFVSSTNKMTQFNEKAKAKDIGTNFEGGIAYNLTPEMELYSMVCCASLQNKYYTNKDDQIYAIRELIPKVDPKYVGQLAIYARDQMYLRAIPLVLTVELAKIHNGDDLVRKIASRVINRADELTEILAYYQLANNRTETKKLNKLSNQIRLGIADAFSKFDEYQFSKYKAEDRDVSLKDALFLSHPKPLNEERTTLYNKIATETLSVPKTWETEMSDLGKQIFASEDAKNKAFRMKWEELIDSNVLGYMATIRNLNNFMKYSVSRDHIIKVCKYLSNPYQVKKSKQLPFRFLSAFRMVSGYTETNQFANVSAKKLPLPSPEAAMILNALEDASIVSAESINGYDYDTTVLIASDVSASMFSPISKRSIVTNYDIGLMMSMMLQIKCKSVITGIFGERWMPYQLPQKGILSNVTNLYNLEGSVGYATNGHLAVEWLLTNNINVDKIMMFTDAVLWDSNGYYQTQNQSALSRLWNRYHAKNPNSKLYLFDLASYGTSPLRIDNKNVFMISGWSDKIFTMLDAIEKGSSTVEVIKSIEI